MSTRREFIAAGAALATVAALLPASGTAAGVQRNGRSLKILVLGGTGFLGPHQIEYALARGHRVTMFNRGSNPGMFGSAVEELVGDRDSRVGAGLQALQGKRRWDVVIDNSGYVPRHVRDSVEMLKERCGRYLYVSTVAVYAADSPGSFDENARLAEPANPDDEKVTGASYGPLKAACDRIVREALGERCTVVRPTFVVGPGDTSDRFTYWVERIARGGDVLAPPGPEREIQWVDARDLCPWIVTLAEQGRPGVFNAAGPASPVDRGGLMCGLRATTAEPITLHWSSDELLAELGINLPMMWRGASVHFDNRASQAAGMRYRALADTARDTLAWWSAQPAERRNNPQGWLDPEQERLAISRIAAAAGST